MTTWLRRRSLPGGGEGCWTSADGRLIFTAHMGTNEPDYDANNPVLRSGQPVEELENLTDAFSREAVDFIRRCGGERPFFLQLAYSAVHSPLQAEPEYLERFAHIEDIRRRIFAAMLAQLDDGVGRVLDALEEEKLSDRTFVALFSDKGGAVRELTSRRKIVRHGAGGRFARDAPPGPWELYHLAEDPSETRDLAESESTRLNELVEAWEALDAGMVEAAF